MILNYLYSRCSYLQHQSGLCENFKYSLFSNYKITSLYTGKDGEYLSDAFPIQFLINNINKGFMDKMICHQIQEESLQISNYENDTIEIKKEISSTMYSKSTKSKQMQQQEDQSISYSRQLKATSSKYLRKEQNKQSAKKCRMRKKERFQELQNREKILQYQLSQLLILNSRAKVEVQKYISGSNIPNIFNNVGRTESYDRLNKIVQQEDIIDEDQINLILDNLRNRVGATGIQRQGKINYIYKQIIQISFPALHRYFMCTADNSFHYFSEKQCQSSWMNGLDAILNLNQNQREVILSKKKNFQMQYQIFSELISEMKQTKGKLQKQSQRLEQLIEDLRYMLNPTQCGKLITFIETNKYKQQMQLWVRRNMRKFSEQSSCANNDPGPLKKPKIQQP